MKLKTNFKYLEKQIIKLFEKEQNCFFEKFEIIEYFNNKYSKNQINKSINNLVKKQIIIFDLFKTYYLFVEDK